MSVPMRPGDPCYWMLEEGLADSSKRSTTTVHMDGCYICDDPEFSLMGLPLCYACSKCSGHVPADDTVCSDCRHDQMDDRPEPTEEQRAQTAQLLQDLVETSQRGHKP